MELSPQVQVLRYHTNSREMSGNSTFTRKAEITGDDIIDVSQIDFRDETWLRQLDYRESPTPDLKAWLYKSFDDTDDLDFHNSQMSLVEELSRLSSTQSIDTRTFTRPKKKFTRPSIEQCNEIFNASKNSMSELEVRPHENGAQLTSSLEAPQFDLTQPVLKNPFDNIFLNCNGADSFINMDPPSLVNSMCSSTFTNPMERSVTKEDEMKSSGYSEQILLQDTEQPIFRSFAESCSSFSSDIYEDFLRKSNHNNFAVREELLKSDGSMDSSKNTLDETVLGKTMHYINRNEIMHSENIDPNTTFTPLNNTYNKTLRINTTFDKPKPETNALNACQKKPSTLVQKFLKQNENGLNCTYTESERDKNINNTFTKNATITMRDITAADTLNSSGRLTKRRSINNLIGKTATWEEDGQRKKRDSSIGSSQGSIDSLDRISSISNSSRGSSRMLNMSEVDALVEMQEKCLYEASSTPIVNKIKPRTPGPKFSFAENSITKPCKSESDLSSADEYLTVGSGLSNNSSTHSINKDTVKNEKHIKAINNEVIAANPRSINTLTKVAHTTNNVQNVKVSNLTNLPTKLKGSATNLRALDSKLKGSYTNLRPLGRNLPHAPSLSTFRPQENHIADVKTSQASTVASDTVMQSKLKAPVKSAQTQPRVSCLPRPIGTGIPRPTSRIPTPNFLRPNSTKSTTRVANKRTDF